MGIIRVDLQCPHVDYIWSPGEIVRGNVQYTIQGPQERLKSVSITFRGKMTTTISESRSGERGGSDTNRENICLFRFTQQLFQGPFDMRAQQLQWPFEFAFPLTCFWDRGRHNDHPDYAPPGELSLPPSMSRSIGSDFALVNYKLKVSIERGLMRQDEVHDTLLRFCPYHTNAAVQPTLQGIQLPRASWSSRELRPEKHDLKQKLRHVFTSDPTLRTPSVSFHISVGIPNAMMPGQSVPLTLSATHEAKLPVDPKNPTLILESVRVALKSITSFRARDVISDFKRVVRDEDAAVIYRVNIRLPLDGTTIQPVADFGLACFGGDNAKFEVTPDFVTWIINHSHYIKVQLRVRHQESGHLFQVKSDRISFACLPPPHQIQTRGGNWHQTNQPPHELQPLPPYTAGEALPLAGFTPKSNDKSTASWDSCQ